jgi:dephospho-CoA kinase
MSTLRIAVIGLSGCGKSTTTGIVAEYATDKGLTCATVKLATPLYDLQEQVYRRAGVEIPPGAQDQVLLEALADAMRRIRPHSLADDFLARLAKTHTDVVLNDDLRDPHVDAVVLRDNGFRILRVTASPEVRQQRLAGRGDLTRADASTSGLDLIRPDAVLDNSGTLADHRAAVHALLGGWL